MHHRDRAYGHGEAGRNAGDAAPHVQELREIRAAIHHLERVCRQGNITPGELAEELDLLKAQQHGLQRRR